jgi:shikimate dehydrogenase
VAIFGDPLTYTRSPAFQNAGFKALGLDWAYLPFPVPADGLAALWKGLARSQNFQGANVTIPHKVAAIKLAARLTPQARGIGAVNTLYRSGRQWVGHNTDAQGFVEAQRRLTGRSLKNKNVVVLGTGGSARAVAWACASQGAATLILGRNAAKARVISRGLARCGAGRLDAEVFEGLADSADVVVNTIPDAATVRRLGLRLPRRPGKGRAVMDITYTPPLSPLLKVAKARGWQVANGLPMLLEQGMLSFQCWTGRPAPRAAMRRALSPGFVS